MPTPRAVGGDGPLGPKDTWWSPRPAIARGGVSRAEGVVTRMLFGLFSSPHSILQSGGRNVLKPWIRFGWPAKSSETLLIAAGVSIL